MNLPRRPSLFVAFGVSLVIASLNGCSASTETNNGDEGSPTATATSELKSSSCTYTGGGGTGSSSSGGATSCTGQAVYQCGADTREIDCSCPQAQCSCVVNGVVTKTFSTTQCSSSSSSCTPTKSDLKTCGIH